jgi:hypothetical protein
VNIIWYLIYLPGGDGHGGGDEAAGGVEDHGDHMLFELWETDSQEPYEILHGDHPNELTFRGYNGIYVFELIIVDASYR